MISIFGADLLATLPAVLKNDETMLAIASTVSDELALLLAETLTPILYARIDELPEELLDVLAYDFKVDWYDQSYDVATKRVVIADNVSVHKKLGTRWAVERVVETYFGENALQEWFEYGGDPYHFKVVSTSDISSETYNRFIKALNIVKNVRSVLEGIVVALAGTWNYYYSYKTWAELGSYTWDEVSAGI